MHFKKNTILVNISSSILAYLFISVAASLIYWLIVMGVLIKIDSIPKIIREGYKNPYSSVLVVYFIFLFPTMVFYSLIQLIKAIKESSVLTKIIIGSFLGFLPITLLNYSAFGLSILGIGEWINILVLSVAGGCLPIIKHLIDKYL